MKTNPASLRLRLGFGLLLGASANLLTALPAARAATLNFHLTLTTASLTANPGAPFSLDLQFSQGNGLSNTVTLRNFTFTGGAATGSPTRTGGASGTFGTGVTLADTGFFNEFFQTFSGTTAQIGFDVSTTLNASAGTPNLFSVSILDLNLNPIQTTSPGSGTPAATDYLVGVPVDDRTTFASIQTYTSNVAGSTTPGVFAAAVPEPSSVALLGLSLGTLGALGLRRRSVRS